MKRLRNLLLTLCIVSFAFAVGRISVMWQIKDEQRMAIRENKEIESALNDASYIGNACASGRYAGVVMSPLREKMNKMQALGVGLPIGGEEESDGKE